MPAFRMIGPIKSSKSVATESTKWITGTTSTLSMRKECAEVAKRMPKFDAVSAIVCCHLLSQATLTQEPRCLNAPRGEVHGQDYRCGKPYSDLEQTEPLALAAVLALAPVLVLVLAAVLAMVYR